MALSFLPYARQQIEQDDIEAVTAVLESDYLTTGPVTKEFEKELAEITEAKFAVSCSSGTAALHLASMALDLKPGDKVIVPSITFLATANAAQYTGADVVFADVNPDNGLMDPDHLETALAIGGDGVKAVFPVHLAGQCADMKAISAVAANNNLSIVEDACHAIGAAYQGDGINADAAVGSCLYSDMTVFSFHPVKTITMGEGGAISTQNKTLQQRLELFRNHGLTREKNDFLNSGSALDLNGEVNHWYYEMQEMGFNYRASDIHCALGLSQLKKLKRYVQRRLDLAAIYDKLLSPLAPIIRPITRNSACNPAWHLYPVLINFTALEMSRHNFMTQLLERGVCSQVHYIPLHHQPYYQDKYGEANLPGANSYYNRTLSLPLFSNMEDEDVANIVDAISQILQ